MPGWFRRSRSDAPETPSPEQVRDLVLYKFDGCPYCQRVQRVIHKLDLDIATKDTLQDSDARRELQDATGKTQVPCLFIDGVPMLESADIADWLRRYAKRA